MVENGALPVIFLAFADDRRASGQKLRNLPAEESSVRGEIDKANKAGLCEVPLVRFNATIDAVLETFRDPRYHDRIAIFHFAGHAKSYQLLFESADGSPHAVDAAGLAKILNGLNGLQLVFLNGCSTQQQAQGLLDAG